MKSRLILGLLVLGASAAVGFGGAAALGGHAAGPSDLAVGAQEQGFDSHEIHQILGGSRKNMLELSGPFAGDQKVSEPIDFVVENGFERAAHIQYVVELVAEDGEAIFKPKRSAKRKIAADGKARFRLDDHGGLRDGFYLYRVTMLGVSGANEADNTLHVPFALRGDNLHLLTDEEWLSYSFVNGASQDVE